MDRVKIIQDGRLAGTIPRPDVDPSDVVSFLIEPRNRLDDPLATIRREDFRTVWCVAAHGWSKEIVLIASPMLGLGDFANIRGFRPATESD